MKMLMLIMILLSINLMFMNHPVSMGFILLMQTIVSSMMCSLNLVSYFMSYILFLIFIGGMLILFMYMSSVASNEKFYFSMKLLMINLLFILMLMNNININFNLTNLIKSLNLYNEYYMNYMNLYKLNYLLNSSLTKLYMFPSGNITLLMVIYLLFIMIIVSNIIKMHNIPYKETNVLSLFV